MDSYLERVQRELEDAIAGATPGDLAKSPEGKWSPAQILEHLYLSYMNTNRGIAKCLEKGTPLVTRATLRHRVGTVLVVNFGYLPGGRKAPERTIPRGISPDEVLRSIFPEVLLMDSGFAELERKFGTKTKILDHPILGPLNAGQWRKFHFVHARHHARQIRQRLTRAGSQTSGR
jgi:hypothetical protein